MNFEIACSHCGAISSPVTGVCPYCKSVMTQTDPSTQPESFPQIQSLYDDGKIEFALTAASGLEKKDPESLKDLGFVLLYVKILLETDAPSSKARLLLKQALADNPSNPDLLEYLELVEAESHISRDNSSQGEVILANIVRRSPKNVHALFLLGSHLLWTEDDPQSALRYLEQCVRFRPNFMRAKACLAATYKALGMQDPATRLLTECANKASDGNVKRLFENFAAQ